MLVLLTSYTLRAALGVDRGTGCGPPFAGAPADHVAAPCAALRRGAARPACETVLIVDDDCDLRLLLRAFLEDLGYTVLEAGDGLEALEILRSRDGDAVVVLVDYWMPHMDGGELLRTILHDAALAGRHACALMTVTVDWLPSSLRTLLAEHAILILAKPFRLAQLEDIVRRCAARG